VEFGWRTESRLVEDVGSRSRRDFCVGKAAWERGGQGCVGIEAPTCWTIYDGTSGGTFFHEPRLLRAE
jgi:hypothetical protein